MLLGDFLCGAYLGLNESYDHPLRCCCCCRVLWARRAICALPSITLSTDIRAQLARERALDALKIFQLHGLAAVKSDEMTRVSGFNVQTLSGKLFGATAGAVQRNRSGEGWAG